jgi:hypothetical protein
VTKEIFIVSANITLNTEIVYVQLFQEALFVLQLTVMKIRTLMNVIPYIVTIKIMKTYQIVSVRAIPIILVVNAKPIPIIKIVSV